ncbi:MAG: DUF3187 family protein [Treponema sp.]|nr:DUF3187 family protein [Treponema sp.]
MRSRFQITFFLLMLSAAVAYSADTSAGIHTVTGDDFSKGPLYGKNLYIPFLIHYNFPSLPARSGAAGDLQWHTSIYYSQDSRFREDLLPGNIDQQDSGGRRYDKALVVRDYESCVAELGFAYNPARNFQAGLDTRIISYYGGFLDSFVEGFHGFFGFPNAKREAFLQNQLYINIPNDNGVPLFLDKAAVSPGDVDLWCKWTFLENNRFSLAALAAFKLPAGSLKLLSGSGSPDAAAGLLADIRASRIFTFYTQAGIVAPFDGKSYPMFNGLLGLEIHPWNFLSFNAQMNIKTSPLSDHIIPFRWNGLFGTDFIQLNLPQTNVLAGLVLQLNNTGLRFYRLQFYIEEDAIFNQGTDFTFGIMFSQTFNNIVNQTHGSRQ